MTTFVLLATMLALCVVSIGLWVVLLRVGLRWARIEGVTTRRTVMTVVAVYLSKFPLLIAQQWPDPVAEPERAQKLTVLLLLLSAIIPCLIISRVFKARFGQAVKAWLPTLGSSVVLALLIFFPTRPFVVESFFVPTNSMAPTILGSHVVDECPVCGESCYGSGDAYDHELAAHDGLMVICDNFHVETIDEWADGVKAADRFSVAKYLKPQRWDVVVFRVPFEPDVLWMMRVVGMPGERIVIEDGVVTADGERLSPPPELSGIAYASTLPEDYHMTEPLWGSAERPAQLGKGEYFVLGDMTLRSRDSRFWPETDSGHPAYALPADNIEGVVSHIYWPPARWRILR